MRRGWPRPPSKQRAKAEQSAAEATQQRHNAEQSANSALQQAYIADLQRNAGTAHSLVAGSEAALSKGSTDTALLLAAQATAFANASGGVIGDNAVKSGLLNALQDNPRLVGWLRGIDGTVAAVTTSQDRSLAAAISTTGQVVVWRLADGKRLGAFNTSGSDVQFLDTNTLVVNDVLGLRAYRTVDGGATWSFAWNWSLACCGGIDSFAASPSGIVVAASDRIELLNPFGHKYWSAVAPGLQYATKITFSPSGTDFAVAGDSKVNPSTFESPFLIDDFETKSGTLVSSVSFAPHDQTNDTPWLTDLRFSSDGRQITALVAGYTIPLHRFWVRTGKEVPLAPPGAGLLGPGQWGPVVPDTPVGLSPNLNEIIQSDPNDPNTVGIGYLRSDNFIDVRSTESSELAFDGAAGFLAPAVTSDSRLLLMPLGDGAVPVFDLSQQPRSHFARVRSVSLGSFIPGTIAVSANGGILASINGPCFCPKPVTLTLTALDGAHRPVHVPLAGSASKGFGSPGLAFNERADELAVANENGSITIIDPATGVTLRQFASPFHHVMPSPTILFFGTLDRGRLVEASIDEGHELWSASLRSGTIVNPQAHSFGTAVVHEVSADLAGNRLVVLTATPDLGVFAAHVFNAAGPSWTEETSFPLPGNELPMAALSPGAAEVVVGDGITGLAGYRTDDGELLWRDTNAGSVGLWFGPDGSLYTESTTTGDIDVRSPFDGSVQYTLQSQLQPTSSGRGSNPPLDSFAFLNGHVLTVSPDPDLEGDHAVLADYPLTTADLVHAACAEAGRNLTHAEWVHYVGSEPYELTCPSLPPPDQ